MPGITAVGRPQDHTPYVFKHRATPSTQPIDRLPSTCTARVCFRQLQRHEEDGGGDGGQRLRAGIAADRSRDGQAGEAQGCRRAVPHGRVSLQIVIRHLRLAEQLLILPQITSQAHSSTSPSCLRSVHAVQVSIVQQPAFCVVRSLIAFRLTSTNKDYCVVGNDAGKITILEYLPDSGEVRGHLPYSSCCNFHQKCGVSYSGCTRGEAIHSCASGNPSAQNRWTCSSTLYRACSSEYVTRKVLMGPCL